MANPSLEIAPTIGSPDRIQPSSIQSDTYEGAERPLIDHNLSRLADSLGVFNSGLQKFGASYARDQLVRDREAEAELKKREKLSHIDELSKYIAGTTPQERLEDARNGKADFSQSPYVGDMYRKEVAHLAAAQLSSDLDAETAQGAIPFGDPSFNPARFVVERAAAVRKTLGKADDAILNHEFSQRLQPIIQAAQAKHTDAAGRALQQQNEDLAYGKFDQIFKGFADRGYNGVDLSDALRSVHKEIGPIMGGGDYGIANGKFDEIMLKVLADRAADPAYAEQAMGVLDAPRIGLDGKELDPLSKSLKNRAAVDHIRTVGTKSLNEAAVKQIQANVLDLDKQSLQRMDGSFSYINDGKIRDKFGNPVPHLGSKERQEAALEAAIDDIRAQNGGKPDFDKEVEITARNNVKHPQFFNSLENAASGLGGTTNQATPIGTPQLQALQQGADMYTRMSAANYSWTEKHLSKEARDTFEKFQILTKEMGRSPEQAAAEIAAYKNSRTAQQPIHFSPDHYTKIDTAVRSIGTGSGGVWSDSPVNQGYVRDKVIDLAKTYAQIEGMGIDKAIEKAQAAVQTRYATVHGAMVSGGEFMPQDAPHMESLLTDLYKANKATLEKEGITRPEELTIYNAGNGVYNVVRRDGGVIAVPLFDDPSDKRKVTGVYSPQITTKELAAKRATAERDAVVKQTDKARRKSGLLKPDGTAVEKRSDIPMSILGETAYAVE